MVTNPHGYSAVLDLENSSAAANAAPPARALDGCQQPRLQPEGSAEQLPASRLHQPAASGQLQRQPGGAGNAAALGQPRVRSALTCLAPRSWLGPSQRLLPRHLVFYCASFSKKPGLPKRREAGILVCLTHQPQLYLPSVQATAETVLLYTVVACCRLQ